MLRSGEEPEFLPLKILFFDFKYLETFLFNISLFLLYVYQCLPVDVSLYHVNEAISMCRVQKRTSDPLELQLQTDVNLCVGAGNSGKS